MIVVDTNLIAYLLINGEYSETAERVLGKDSDWVAPYLWRSEFRSVLVKCLRDRRLELNDSFRIMAEAEALMSECEYAVSSPDVISLAASSACSPYDAEFVVLARELSVPLITLDRRLLEKFPETAVAPDHFCPGV